MTCRRAILVVILFAGCGKPLTFFTRSKLAVEGPVVTQSRLAIDPIAGPSVSEVIAWPVERAKADATCRIAVVDVDGLLANSESQGPLLGGENPVSLFKERLAYLRRDPSVKGVVIRINSPGGSVTASDILTRELDRFGAETRLPVVACLMDVGTGGSYMLATAADEIVAHPTSIVGGIGVIINLYNLRDAMAYFNVLNQSVKAGPQIDLGSPVAPMSQEAKKILQQIADELHGRFIARVRERRPGSSELPDSFFDGRIFSASVALQHRLVDRIGYLDDAIALAKQKANLTDAEVVLLKRANEPARSIYSSNSAAPAIALGNLPISIPGLDRSRLPTFLYLWQPETTLEKHADN